MLPKVLYINFYVACLCAAGTNCEAQVCKNTNHYTTCVRFLSWEQSSGLVRGVDLTTRIYVSGGREGTEEHKNVFYSCVFVLLISLMLCATLQSTQLVHCVLKV